MLTIDMDKNANESPYIEFRMALNYLIDKDWQGRQKVLVDSAEISFGYLSQLKKGERVSSTKVQYALASALKTSYEKMIRIGKNILKGKAPEDLVDNDTEYSIKIKALEDRAEKLFGKLNENDEPKIIECRQHEDIIRFFKNKEIAKEINQLLLKVENIEPERLEEIKEYIEMIYKRLSKKNDMASSA